MTIGYLKDRSVRTGTPYRSSSVDPWVRPTDWLPLTDPVVGENKIVCLWAVYADQTNWFCLNLAGASYTVDYGDGLAPTAYTSGTQVRRHLNFADYSSSTLTSRGYRQAVVTITATSGSFSTADMANILPTGFSAYYYSCLDMRIASSSLTQTPFRAQGNRFPMLENFKYVGTNSMLDCYRNFYLLYRLAKCEMWFGATTSASEMLNGCANLREVDIDAPLCTSFNSALSGATSLRRATITSGASNTNFQSTFNSCPALSDVQILGNTSNVTNTLSMFSSCGSLVDAPMFDTAKVTLMNGMFSGCALLQNVPLYDTSLVTDMSTMFQSCRSLITTPLFNTANVVTMSAMFNACSLLEVIPNFNTVKVTNFSQFAQGCTRLVVAPALDTSACVSASNMFWTCSSLHTIPAYNFAAIPNATAVNQAISGCTALRSAQFTGLRFSVLLPQASFSAANLDAFYTALGTAASAGQTVTVTGNYGTTGDTPSIATAKGWTVTGS